MNIIHRRYCRSGRWQHHLDDLLPWATDGIPLNGARVLELGSGPGLTTDWLVTRVGTLTALEFDAQDAATLAARRPDVTVVHADATEMPLPEASFDVVVCFTMLHHLPSERSQDQLFTEARRVLVPGGVFAGSDSKWGPLFALAHVRDTMTLIGPERLPQRLNAAGLVEVQVDARPRALRFRAQRP
ncbi:class I SAM-dependent methyltransferase [Modestobacter altitudinis]|uniref:class I SAM-dependent methyltransferase n=1 Tax=Modestobacter altitudinis TaxID=2213158 RepID=UPI001C5500B0|nr:class I SAM-dependent methyltransferase [Modestobacter altitudinis]